MTPTEISERLQRIQYLFSAGVITNVDRVEGDERLAQGEVGLND